ncbi:hypothetical protein TWF506_000216 [Arthrobotrys conoides]|uniref:Uncharacterized protein n=1 Tax=Arthrobotrys conoides TaxID=74498 RepID=A0AAN8NV04_9PEZI
MWVAHFAPSLLLACFAPSTPLWALAFAGTLPDFLFFALNIAAALLLATLSHLPLNIAISLDESGVSEYKNPIWQRDARVPLLDYPWGTFTSDLGIFVFAMLFHAC